jgi:predicted component of type VI protein secretion system
MGGRQSGPVVDPGGFGGGVENVATEQEPLAARGPVRDEAAAFEVVAGNDKGRAFNLPWTEAVVGRGAQCDFVLADLAVSRRHVTVNFDGAAFVLTDQGSGNGTKVNGVKIASHALMDGDEVELGKTLLRFRWSQAVAAQAVAPEAHPGAYEPAAAAPAQGLAPAVGAPVHPSPAPPPAPVQQPGPPPPQGPADGSSYTEAVDPLPPGVAPAPDLSPPTGRVMPAVGTKGKVFGFLSRLTDTTPKKVLVLGGLGVIFVLMSLAMVGKLRGKRRKSKPAAASGQAQPTQEQLYEDAKRLFKARQWEQAEQVFRQLAQTEPDNPFIKNKLEEIRKNVIARKYLQDAQQALKAGDQKKAEVFISAIGKDTPFYFGEGQKLQRSIQEKRADKLLADAAALKTDKKKRKAAMAKVEEALKLAPGYRPALVLRHELGGPPPPPLPDAAVKARPGADAGQPTEPRVAEVPRPVDPRTSPDPTRVTARARAMRPATRGSTPSVRISSGGSHKQAMAFYRARNWSAAYAELRRVAASQRGRKGKRTQSLAGKVKRMGAQFQRAEANQHRNSYAAMKAYQRALSLDSSISRGAHAGYIKSKLAKVARAAAGSAFSTGRYAQAYQAVKIAKRYGGSSGGVRRILSQLENQAKLVFSQGYIKRDSNLSKAKSLWRKVLRMVPSSSVWYKKAKWFLSNYGKAKSMTSDEDEL